MSGKDVQPDSGSLPKQFGVRCKGVDRINQLPDDIIVYILSFLSLKERVATSPVSPRWSQLWKYTPNLIFRDDITLDPVVTNIPITLPEHMRGVYVNPYLIRCFKNIEWVNTVLNFHRALTLKKFEISFDMHKDSQPQNITNWVHFAISRQVEKLKLNLMKSSHALDNIFCDLGMSEYKFLKVLKLKNLNARSESIELFLRSCPLLEELTIKYVTLMSNLIVMGRNLKKFVIAHHGKTMITVDAPNLTCLACRYYSSKLLLQNVPNLVEASYYLSKPEDTMDHFAKAAPELEILNISLACSMVLRLPHMPKLNKIVFDYSAMIARPEFLLPVTSLIHASPCLQQLTIKVKYNELYYGKKFRRERRIFEVPDVCISLHHHLSVFEFSGFCLDAADHMDLLSYVVNNCVALKEISIIPIYPIIAENPASRYAMYSRSISSKPQKEVKQRRNREGYPYKIYPSSYDEDVCEAAYEDGLVYAKKWTEQQLACKVPHHIKVIVRMDPQIRIYG